MVEESIITGISAGGLTGIVLTVCLLLYKCLQQKKIQSKCCGGEFSLQNEVVASAPAPAQAPPTPPQKIEISLHTPTLKAEAEPPHSGRRASAIVL
jgi:hypothetical protein